MLSFLGKKKPQIYTLEDVAKHNSASSLWLVIGGTVYDVTKFHQRHPGGPAVMLSMAGKDATDAANNAHKSDLPAKVMKEFVIGTVREAEAVIDKAEEEQKQVEEDRASQKSHESGKSGLSGKSGRSGLSAARSLSHAETEDGPLRFPRNDPDGMSPPIEEETEFTEDALVTATDIVTNSFGELQLPPLIIEASQNCWRLFLQTVGGPEEAGQAIYAALYEGAPILQPLFLTPRAVQAMRFMHGLGDLVMLLDDGKKLKSRVETLGFGHLYLDVTVSNITMFRDAILDLFAVELGDGFTPAAAEGWKTLMNYAGGAYVFTKGHCAERINTVLTSWKIASGQAADEARMEEKKESTSGSGSGEAKAQATNTVVDQSKKGNGVLSRLMRRSRYHEAGPGMMSTDGVKAGTSGVPTTYGEMFVFNSAVMGLGERPWLAEVLACFDNIVSNIGNAPRLQEECDVLVLRITKCQTGPVNFSEYKSCMLSSLRALLPKDWSTAHEVAWSWLWDNVERFLNTNFGKPANWGVTLSKFLTQTNSGASLEMQQHLYSRFSSVDGADEDFYKQSNTFLHYVSEKLLSMTNDFYRDPVTLVDDISALGLRHVGYGIPVELFGPFVTVCIEVISSAVQDPAVLEAFRWSIALISKKLTRTITEGSTVVMRAINKNSAKELEKAVSSAPRGQRANWMLVVQVGTQNISPLAWAIESGSYEAARTMLNDLLTFRADRDRYYYGADELFGRHPDLIQRLCADAPVLLPTLFDGLLWRSRVTEDSMRRVNYYVKHLLLDDSGNFAKAIQWITEFADPKVVCHPVIILLSDIVWSRVAAKSFLKAKSWFLLTLAVFLAGQSVIPHVGDASSDVSRFLVLACRLFIYFCSLGRFVFNHTRKLFLAVKGKHMHRIGCLPIPKYLEDWQEGTSFILMTTLFFMILLEPILWCWSSDELFTTTCEQASDTVAVYSIFSACAMFLYYVLLADLVVFSNRVSAFSLVCSHMCSEVALFLLALACMVLMFSSAISVLDQDITEFSGIVTSAGNLFQMTLGMVGGVAYESFEDEPVVLITCFAFIIVTLFFLLNLLIAQLTCAYNAIYSDMVGFARLQRMRIIVETMPAVPARRWETFVISLNFATKLEFNAGDVGVGGGIQVKEPASANPTTDDSILRYGGSTSPSMQWPEEEEKLGDDPAERFDRMEKLVVKSMQQLMKSNQKSRQRTAQGDPHASQVSSGSHTEELVDDGDEC